MTGRVLCGCGKPLELAANMWHWVEFAVTIGTTTGSRGVVTDSEGVEIHRCGAAS